MRKDSSRNPGEAGQAETGVVKKPPEGRGPAGLTGRLAAARLDALAAEVRK